jgi:hypothetical protein
MNDVCYADTSGGDQVIARETAPSIAAGEEDSGKASTRGPPDASSREESMEDGVRTTTMHQLLNVVEALENELFQAEARRHEAEVTACLLAFPVGLMCRLGYGGIASSARHC